MSGTFDSAISSVDFYESTVASNASAVLSAQTYTFPYDVEVVGAGISGQTSTTASNIWANVKYTPAGTAIASNTGTALFSRPFGPESIKQIKLDQSYVTVTGTAPVTTATSNAAITVATTALTLGASNSNVKVGQGVVVGGSTVVGNYVTAFNGTTGVTLAKPTTVASTVTTIAFFDSPTPQPGQQVQILNITDPTYKVVNNDATGTVSVQSYAVVDSSESTSAQTFRVGPLKQAKLYDTNTGFWNFTAPVSTAPAGTWQIIDALLLPGGATAAARSQVYNAPDIAAKIPAGTVLSVEWSSVNAAGSTVTGVIATSVSLNLAVKKA